MTSPKKSSKELIQFPKAVPVRVGWHWKMSLLKVNQVLTRTMGQGEFEFIVIEYLYKRRCVDSAICNSKLIMLFFFFNRISITTSPLCSLPQRKAPLSNIAFYSGIVLCACVHVPLKIWEPFPRFLFFYKKGLKEAEWQPGNSAQRKESINTL